MSYYSELTIEKCDSFIKKPISFKDSFKAWTKVKPKLYR